jgi:uncharacterized protein YegL
MATPIYPLYIFIDNSGSMAKQVNGKRLIDLARLIPSELLDLYTRDNSLVTSLRVALFDFNFKVDILQKLATIPKLRTLKKPLEPKGKTFFSSVFKEVRNQVITDYGLDIADLANVPPEVNGNVMMKPAVLIVTDGIPSDPPEARKKAYESLGLHLDGKIDKTIFPIPPQIIILGVGEGEFDRIGIYDTSKLDPQSRIRRAKNFADVGEHMREIAHWIQIRITKSLADPVLDQDDDWFNTDEDDHLEDPWA